ncbi:NADPH-dependent F420 reductase [Actinacidiphila alni]|uniref:NADPH-dependent F420 reductase n=1 Tax=Actinacidiphila alni TaxID=380248 RepID=UPI003F4CBC84
MRIGILGTGVLARALAEGWARAGHEVVVGGRSAERAHKLAEAVGRGVTAAGPRTAAAGRDAVLLAVDWDGAEEMLAAAGADEGALAGTVLIDPTNAVEHGVGVLLTGDGSMAARIAARAPGADVVKAFHLFPATQWTQGAGAGDGSGNGAGAGSGNGEAAGSGSSDAAGGADVPPVTVVICGDAPAALDTVGTLVRDVGARPAVLGGLDRARQLEEAAGFVIGLVFAGHDPNSAVPHVPSR